MNTHLVLLSAVILFVHGCSSSSSSTDASIADMGSSDDIGESSNSDSDALSTDARGDSSPDTRDASTPEGVVGEIRVYSASGTSYAEVSLFDQPYLIRAEHLPALDTCQVTSLKERATSFYGQCSPSCDSGEYCGIDNSCHVWPAKVRAGNITMSFGGAAYPAYYSDDAEQPTAPEIPAQQSIEVSAEGSAAFPAFSMTVQSVALPVVSSPAIKPLPQSQVVDVSSEMNLTWQSSDKGAIRVVLTPASASSSNTKQIVCHLADDGEATIASVQLAQLEATGKWLLDFTRIVSTSTSTSEGTIAVEVYAYTRGLLSPQ